MMRYSLIQALALVLSFAMSVPAFAHPKNNALTTILVKDGKLEVTHRFFLHDVEFAARRLFNADRDFVVDASAQMEFGKYLTKKFAIKTKKYPVLPLVYVGHEVDGKYFWVYQEYLSAADFTTMALRHSVLMDVLPKQQNLVNLEGNGKIKSVSFTKKDDWKTLY